MEYIRTNLQNTERCVRNDARGRGWQDRLPVAIQIQSKQLAADCCDIPHETGHKEAKNKGRLHPVGELHGLFKQGKKNIQVMCNTLD